MDDVEYDNLVEGIRHRKEAALATLFDLYYEKLYLFAELRGSIRHYLFTSVRNGCLNYLKSLQIEDRNNRKYAEAYIESQNVDMVEDEELLAKIRQVMEELPERCREVCMLRFGEGYKYSEIAERLGMNENTVKAQLHRGMERLREAFANYDYVVVLCALGRLFMEH